MIDIHRLNFYLTVRQDVDRVVGGFIRNLRDIENGKLRRTLSFDQYSMDQRDLSSISSTQEFYSARHLPHTVSSFPNCSSGSFQQPLETSVDFRTDKQVTYVDSSFTAITSELTDATTAEDSTSPDVNSFTTALPVTNIFSPTAPDACQPSSVVSYGGSCSPDDISSVSLPLDTRDPLHIHPLTDTCREYIGQSEGAARAVSTAALTEAETCLFPPGISIPEVEDQVDPTPKILFQRVVTSKRLCLLFFFVKIVLPRSLIFHPKRFQMQR